MLDTLYKDNMASKDMQLQGSDITLAIDASSIAKTQSKYALITDAFN